MGCLRGRRIIELAGLLLVATVAFAPAQAQDPEDLRRGVARISVMNGDVSVRRGDAGEWVAGVINAPLLTDDRISTAPNSRAEVQFDAAHMIRIGGDAEIRLTQLESDRYQMEIARGTVTYRVLRPTSAKVEVDTPSISVHPSNQGIYRISVDAAGETEVTVRAGEVEIFTPRGSQSVSTGQTLRARGQSDPEFQVLAAIGYDDWDRWNENRDRTLVQSKSYQYVGSGVYGVEDLDTNGTWSYVEPYGYCWRPTVVADWAPYRSGRWVWQDWYGWTWVSYEPWGWAPYHYGRWFHEARWGWCWYPGMVARRHYWSPALVAFFGFGHGGGVGFGFGNVGWVPLAPYEVYRPWWGRGYYRGGGRFNRDINITNINVVNVYRNARGANGVSGVAEGDFRQGRFHNVMRVSGDQVREAGLVRGQMPLAPDSNHLRFSERQASFTPRPSQNTRFFTRHAPDPVGRTAVARPETDRGRANGGGVAERSAGSQVAEDRSSRSGWRRFGEPGRAPTAEPRSSRESGGVERQGSPNSDSRGTGWRRMGDSDGTPAGRRDSGQSEMLRNSRPPSTEGGSGWSRFGDPGTPKQPAARTERDTDPGWGRFGNPGSGNRMERREPVEAPRMETQRTPRMESQRENRGGFGGGMDRSRSGSSGESMRISPPVVRERSSSPGFGGPRGDSGASRGSSGGGSPQRSNGGGSRGEGGGRPSGGGNRGSRR